MKRATIPTLRTCHTFGYCLLIFQVCVAVCAGLVDGRHFGNCRAAGHPNYLTDDEFKLVTSLEVTRFIKRVRLCCSRALVWHEGLWRPGPLDPCHVHVDRR